MLMNVLYFGHSSGGGTPGCGYGLMRLLLGMGRRKAEYGFQGVVATGDTPDRVFQLNPVVP